MILDYFSPRPEVFRPSSIEQYTALQIARSFEATANLKDHLLVTERHPISKIIAAYRTAAFARDKQETFFQALNH